jgi:hypothetical protein
MNRGITAVEVSAETKGEVLQSGPYCSHCIDFLLSKTDSHKKKVQSGMQAPSMPIRVVLVEPAPRLSTILQHELLFDSSWLDGISLV